MDESVPSHMCRQCRGDFMVLSGQIRCGSCGMPAHEVLVSDLVHEAHAKAQKDLAAKLVAETQAKLKAEADAAKPADPVVPVEEKAEDKSTESKPAKGRRN